MTEFKKGDPITMPDGRVGKFDEYWYDGQAMRVVFGEDSPYPIQIISVEAVLAVPGNGAEK